MEKVSPFHTKVRKLRGSLINRTRSELTPHIIHLMVCIHIHWAGCAISVLKYLDPCAIFVLEFLFSCARLVVSSVLALPLLALSLSLLGTVRYLIPRGCRISG